jgi:hypothetical protein
MKPSVIASLICVTFVAACGAKSPQAPAPEAAAAAANVPAAPTESTPPTAQPANVAFDKVLEMNGVTFHVTCPNSSSVNTVTIVPTGLEIDNAPISREADGTVTGAEVADINSDGSPEIYVYLMSAGSGSYASVVAYSANRKKSLSEIYLPPVSESPAAAKGYMGHDQFAVVENTLVQRFPLYAEGDTNSAPSGKTRQLQYKLVPGEAGWLLKLDKTVDY